MKTKKIVSLILASMLAVSSFAACSTKPTDTQSSGTGEPAQTGDGKEIVDFTMFAAMAGKEKNEGNDIMEMLNLNPSRQVGMLKKMLNEAVVNGEINSSYNAGATYVKEKAKQLGII